MAAAVGLWILANRKTARKPEALVYEEGLGAFGDAVVDTGVAVEGFSR
jgi:hypothetical protein